MWKLDAEKDDLGMGDSMEISLANFKSADDRDLDYKTCEKHMVIAYDA